MWLKENNISGLFHFMAGRWLNGRHLKAQSVQLVMEVIECHLQLLGEPIRRDADKERRQARRVREEVAPLTTGNEQVAMALGLVLVGQYALRDVCDLCLGNHALDLNATIVSHEAIW